MLYPVSMMCKVNIKKFCADYNLFIVKSINNKSKKSVLLAINFRVTKTVG